MAEDRTTDNRNHPNDDDHKQLYHWIYVAGFCLLFSVVDFAFLWPESHLAALLMLATAASLIAIYELRVRNFPTSDIGASVFVIFVLAIIGYFIIGPVNMPEIQTMFALLPADEPTPETGCDPDTKPENQPYYSLSGLLNFRGQRPKESPPKDATIVALGNNAIIVTGDKRQPILGVERCESIISVQKTTDGVSIDASIYDSEGKLAAQIRNNVLTALTAGDLQISREGNLSELIARDHIGERLWVRYLNPHALKIRGIFICPGGNGVVQVTDEGTKFFTKESPSVFTSWGNQCATDAPLNPASR